jgi:hypothetical protein
VIPRAPVTGGRYPRSNAWHVDDIDTAIGAGQLRAIGSVA